MKQISRNEVYILVLFLVLYTGVLHIINIDNTDKRTQEIKELITSVQAKPN